MMANDTGIKPAIILCPYCGTVHIDRDGWETEAKAHRKHLCLEADGGCNEIFILEGVNGQKFYGVPAIVENKLQCR